MIEYLVHFMRRIIKGHGADLRPWTRSIRRFAKVLTPITCAHQIVENEATGFSVSLQSVESFSPSLAG